MSDAGLAGDSGSEVERGVQLSAIVFERRALDLSGSRGGEQVKQRFGFVQVILLCAEVCVEELAGDAQRERLRHSLRVPRVAAKGESNGLLLLPSGTPTAARSSPCLALDLSQA